MIATVTLNTSVDKMYRLDSPMIPGKVMRVTECRNSAGGKGLNVARVIALCGEPVMATGFVGGHNGALLKELLNQDKIESRFIETGKETRCCLNIITPDQKSTELLEPGPELSEECREEFIDLFGEIAQQNDVITISGSSPQGLQTDIYKDLIRIANEHGKKVILDTSQALLAEGLKALPEMIKPNQDEIEALLGIHIREYSDVLDGAVKLHETGIHYVAVSMGKDGAVIVCRQGIFHGRPPVLQAVNTVGCGDSMVGAFAVGLKRGYMPEELLRYGVAVSAANALSAYTGNFNRSDLERILPEVEVKRVN